MVLAIDGDLAGALLHPNAGDGIFALAGGIGAPLGIDLLLVDAHRLSVRHALLRAKIFERPDLGTSALGAPRILGIQRGDIELLGLLRLVGMFGARHRREDCVIC